MATWSCIILTATTVGAYFLHYTSDNSSMVGLTIASKILLNVASVKN